MPAKKEPAENLPAQRRLPATTPEAREQQMIELADRVAEQQMLNGTASSQVITHYLKRGSTKDQAELEKIELEKLRLKAQIAQIESMQRAESLMEDVLVAMKKYAGVDEDED